MHHAQQLLSQAAGPELIIPPERGGVLYVLHDGMNGLTKIGCTRGDGGRQRAIMGSHGSVLINVVNATVADRRGAESQCHRHFKDSRTNGEWFKADLTDIITYIGTQVDWDEISYESQARMMRYLMACKLGDVKAAKNALVCTIPQWPGTPD